MEIGVLMICVIAFFYFVPTMVAVGNRCPNSGAIFLIDLLFGWSIIGWIAALIWASIDKRAPEAPAGAAPAPPPASFLDAMASKGAPMVGATAIVSPAPTNGRYSTGMIALAVVCGIAVGALSGGAAVWFAIHPPVTVSADATSTDAPAIAAPAAEAPAPAPAASDAPPPAPDAPADANRATVTAITPCSDGRVEITLSDGTDFQSKCTGAVFYELKVGDVVEVGHHAVAEDAPIDVRRISRPEEP